MHTSMSQQMENALRLHHSFSELLGHHVETHSPCASRATLARGTSTPVKSSTSHFSARRSKRKSPVGAQFLCREDLKRLKVFDLLRLKSSQLM